MAYPKIIQGGMGIGISNWQLARAVASQGQLGVVSGTSLDNVLVRRLQEGDPGGHMRRAAAHFPNGEISRAVLDKYYIAGGKAAGQAFASVPLYTVQPRTDLIELTVLANFVEIFLAKEGHDGEVGINLMEKIQMPTMASLYGAILAGVDYVLMGAGIPREIPGIIDLLAQQQAATQKLSVENASDDVIMHFDPLEVMGMELPALKRPRFLAIIASVTLAQALLKRATGQIDGFIIEAPTAGGHNAPPRGQLQLTEEGEPLYGPRDEVDLDKIRSLGLPFWLAGSRAEAEHLQQVLEQGGAGIQVGTAFALCRESGLDDTLKQALIQKVMDGSIDVFTDPVASPTGFPFKVVQLEGTLSEDTPFYAERERMCNLGYLRTVYAKEDGTLGYRCASESVEAYVNKGGTRAEAEGRKCLCNALMANIGLPQIYRSGRVELPLLTAGDDIACVARFLGGEKVSYSAAEVIDYLLQGAVVETQNKAQGAAL